MATTKSRTMKTNADGETGHGPAQEFRFGRVKCTVWKNSGATGDWFSVQLSRSYKTDDGWKTTTAMGRLDLLPAAQLFEQAAQWIASQPRPLREKASDEIPE